MERSLLSLYLKHLSRRPPLDREDEKTLSEIMNGAGPDALEAKKVMIEANLRLVIAIAKEHQRLGVELEDLIAEGNLGLIKAIERFDPSQGNKLSTYACWWIRQYIHQTITDHNKTIRVPTHAATKLRKLKKITQELSLKLERAPSLEEISEETNLKVEQIEKILRWEISSVSINQTTQNDEEFSLENYIPDDKENSPLEILFRKNDHEWTSNLLECLSEKEKEVLQRRYGIPPYHEETLEEIGKVFQVSRERIRQIENRALKKLRQRASHLVALSKQS
jgi:RNA polymerase primary sigma factor